jgi:DNA-binding MarR family transcriptional regulator
MTRRTGVDHCNCTALRKASRCVSQMYGAKLADSGLRTTQFAILALLHDLEVLSVNEVAGRLDMDRTMTGKNLRPLEEAGLRILFVADNRCEA